MTDHNPDPDHRPDPIGRKEATMGQHTPGGRQPTDNKPDSPAGHGPAPRSALTPGHLLAALLLDGQQPGAALSADTRKAIAMDQTAVAAWAVTKRFAVESQARAARDAQRAAAGLIAGSIPPNAIALIEACAVDCVPLPATAAGNCARPTAPAGNGGDKAGAALPDPEGLISRSSDPEGRLLSSFDPDALSDRRSAARAGGLPAAHHAVIAIACDRHDDAEHPDPARAGCPPFALGVSVLAAGQPPGPAARDLIRRVIAASPRISEVAYDRGLAAPPDGLAQALRALGIRFAADRPRSDLGRARRRARAEDAVRHILSGHGDRGRGDSDAALSPTAGTAARTMALAALAAAYNVRLARRCKARTEGTAR